MSLYFFFTEIKIKMCLKVWKTKKFMRLQVIHQKSRKGDDSLEERSAVAYPRHSEFVDLSLKTCLNN